MAPEKRFCQALGMSRKDAGSSGACILKGVRPKTLIAVRFPNRASPGNDHSKEEKR
jgi:hypothetical protein